MCISGELPLCGAAGRMGKEKQHHGTAALLLDTSHCVGLMESRSIMHISGDLPLRNAAGRGKTRRHHGDALLHIPPAPLCAAERGE